MNIEDILRKADGFSEVRIEKVLFESTYPILFSCKLNEKVFLFIYHAANSVSMKWIATETTYENLISLLKDQITIREAFMNCSNTKFMISYDGSKTECYKCLATDIPDYILPTDGEKMDVEEDEFNEEITYYEDQNKHSNFVPFALNLAIKCFLLKPQTSLYQFKPLSFLYPNASNDSFQIASYKEVELSNYAIC